MAKVLELQSKDIFFSFGAAILMAVFALPTLSNTGLYSWLPAPLLLLFIVLPALTVVGMYIATYLARKMAVLWQLAKFALVGVLNTAIDFGILNFLILGTGITGGTGIILINAASFSTALINSYFWNKEWVFAGSKRANFKSFAIVTLIGLGINTGIVFILTTFFPPIFVTSETLWANLAKVMATGVSLVWNFAGYKLIVFKR